MLNIQSEFWKKLSGNGRTERDFPENSLTSPEYTFYPWKIEIWNKQLFFLVKALMMPLTNYYLNVTSWH